MKGSPLYLNRDDSFWGYVKFISQELGYGDRKTNGLKRYQLHDVISLCLAKHGLNTEIFVDFPSGKHTPLAVDLLNYLNYRAQILEEQVEPLLMDRDEARIEFEKLRDSYDCTCNLPLNKQKKEKRHHAYLTCITNILTEMSLGGKNFDDRPNSLTIVIENNKIIKTFSRWMDGAYPSVKNPIAVWEIKEYYGTTTFGSRVADGVYETMLDGLEIKALEREKGIEISNYLIIDDKFTWWKKGKSYLCRLIDLLNMGLVDEVIFGREILDRWPEIVKTWKE